MHESIGLLGTKIAFVFLKRIQDLISFILIMAFLPASAFAVTFAWVQYNSFLSGSEGINGTLSDTWSSNVFDPGEASSVNFYWGTGLRGHPTADYLSVLHRDPFPTQAPQQLFLELG